MTHTCNYDFKKDLQYAQKTEYEIINLLIAKYGMKYIARCNNNKYDVEMESKDGKRFTFEIKEDFTHARTGNIGVEYESWGRPAGVAVSQADYYIYKVHNADGSCDIYLLKTETLKAMIENKLYWRTITGGDIGSESKNYLFKDFVYAKYAKKINE